MSAIQWTKYSLPSPYVSWRCTDLPANGVDTPVSCTWKRIKKKNIGVGLHQKKEKKATFPQAERCISGKGQAAMVIGEQDTKYTCMYMYKECMQ